VLNGGAGNDTLIGGGGMDTYVYAPGDGIDTIDDQGWAGGDKLRLTGINPADVSIDRDSPNGGKLVITFPGSPGDRITINDYFGWAGGIE
ncbi:hypothetical protein, partial [Providencia stuartii]|uniref:hypothetical protein n=1 Tax=Providencia stuartii TaxID=588 RepID=UPI001954E715